MALPYSRSEIKDRAREQWHGACNVTLPSFTADFSGLNRQGIAHDVRRAAEHGFWGTLVASESGTTLAEYVQFMEIAADAAPSDLRLVAHLSFSTVEESLQAADAASGLGFEAALLSYPPSFRPTSATEVVAHTRHVAESTDLALVLFAVMTWGFKHLHPTGFPPEALEEMARLETAAALKFEAGGPAALSALVDVHRRVGAHVLVENPMEQYGPALMETLGVQWIGTSGYEAFGDRVPRWMDLLRHGKWDEAMEVFWSYQAAREAKGAFHATFAGANLIHRNGWKYLSYLQGYNGGLLRMPQMRLLPGQMKALRAGLAASGYDLPEDDEQFWTGRFPA
ncbi:dihydrodipicolinate synthase family protein [Geodermatophilus sp. DSM 44513]|uniref:dihydrodipicolinate synthase family protein n=1 Tax=Geodermatophilus sp. DSM 44513 TaxID=1528104 RepID=UPI001280C090|nr:dihydrodipicolinate synthase family protein [Geodermatophilus sp. DSM 44513]WNV77085.1 dihydrodipicolinate synthase family protein [Geodermatophilus sp. DSM 44513]